ncbi:phosphoribulokinase [Streptococcus gallolyticus]|uniref:uridine kinase family protein n=1 Tax=Streptococcus hepaticus TaxID=3349163 RepID=UPI001C97DC50|nr:phosphoribulokinase [Streptococcus gallolyticus]MBY5041865.1 phosphoribulokinase [Streptococcus gallolyticus]
MKKEELLQAIAAFCKEKISPTIRICGHGGSRKSNFAEELTVYLGADRVNLPEGNLYVIPGQISKQLFLKADQDGHLVDEAITACHPARHELISLKRDIAMLKRGMDLLTPDMPWKKEEVLRGSKPILLVEGMSPTFLDKDLFDLPIFIYTDAETELSRRLARDVAERRRIPDFIQKNADRRRRQYQAFMESYKEDFDIIINQSANQFLVEAVSFPK